MVETLHIRLDCRDAIASLATAVALTEGPAEPGEGCVQLLDPAVAFVTHLDPVPASGTGQFRVRLEPTEALVEYVRALGASDAVLERIVQAFSDEVVSEGGVATPTVARSGEGPA